jgi:hypothetical protein
MAAISSNDQCSVCLEEISSQETQTTSGEKAAVRTNCNHIFHNGCVQQWLETNDSCPLCRANVTEMRFVHDDSIAYENDSIDDTYEPPVYRPFRRPVFTYTPRPFTYRRASPHVPDDSIVYLVASIAAAVVFLVQRFFLVSTSVAVTGIAITCAVVFVGYTYIYPSCQECFSE